jgi:drug/metabolite transporter (DMT)-like permease
MLLMLTNIFLEFSIFLINDYSVREYIIKQKLLGHSSSKLGYVFAILAALMFGSVSTVAKPVVSSVHPLLLSSLVYLITAIVLAPVAYRRKDQRATTTGGKKGKRRDYLLVIAIAITGGVFAPSLYFAGLQQTSASDATLLANGEIIFTIAIAMAFFKERLRPLGYLAVLLVLLGVIIITTNLHFASSALFSQETYYGNVLVLGSTLFWAIDNNISKLVAKRMDNVAKVAYLKGAIGGGILLLAVALFNIPIGEIRQNQMVPILLLGIVGFGGSLYFFLEGLKRIGAVRAILLLSLSSVFGLVFAAIFMGEHVSAYQMIAAAIMLSGIYIINRKESSIIAT